MATSLLSCLLLLLLAASLGFSLASAWSCADFSVDIPAVDSRYLSSYIYCLGGGVRAVGEQHREPRAGGHGAGVSAAVRPGEL